MRLLLTLLLCLAAASTAMMIAHTPASAQTLGTCKIFPSNNPWNTRVDSLQVDLAHSTAYLAHISTKHLQPDFSIPYNVVGASQPFVKVTATLYPGESDPGPMPVPPNALQEGPSDSHVLVADTGNHRLYEMWQGAKNPDNSWDASNTAIFALDSNNYRPDGWTSCDAAGLPLFPGLLRYDECAAGEIKHALRFTIPTTQRGWIFPARHQAGSTTDTTVLPMGARLRLKASYDISGFTGFDKVVAVALKKYGMILADNGSSIFISGEPNPNWTSLDQIRTIHATDLEVVYTGPVRTQANQYPDPVLPIPSGTTGVSAPAFAYDTVLAGTSNTFPVVLRNTGNATITVNTIKIKAAIAYATNATAPLTIAPNGSLSIPIIFSPSVPGQIVDTLTIKSDDPTNPSIKVPLVGLGTQGVFHLNQPSNSFGKVVLGHSDTMFFSFNNIGLGALSVDANNLNGSNADFSIVGIQPPGLPPFLVQPGDSIQAQVQFIPLMIGKDTTMFILSLSDYVGESHDTIVTLTGEGIASSSVADPRQPLGIRIYPNPTQGMLTVSGQAAGTIGITVIDALGRNVLSEKLAATGGSLDLSGLPNGSYFVHLSTPSGHASQHIELLR